MEWVNVRAYPSWEAANKERNRAMKNANRSGDSFIAYRLVMVYIEGGKAEEIWWLQRRCVDEGGSEID